MLRIKNSKIGRVRPTLSSSGNNKSINVRMGTLLWSVKRPSGFNTSDDYFICMQIGSYILIYYSTL